MTSLEEHKRKIREHLDEINDALDEGFDRKPITLGFHTSSCAIELLEMYLHKLNLISAGKTIKHNWFEKPKPGQKIAPMIERKMPVAFPEKEQIYRWIYNIEEHRDHLIYGKLSSPLIKDTLENFNHLKQKILERLKELGEEIE